MTVYWTKAVFDPNSKDGVVFTFAPGDRDALHSAVNEFVEGWWALHPEIKTKGDVRPAIFPFLQQWLTDNASVLKLTMFTDDAFRAYGWTKNCKIRNNLGYIPIL